MAPPPLFCPITPPVVVCGALWEILKRTSIKSMETTRNLSPWISLKLNPNPYNS
ncbi:hypothetical protein Hanom_Chr04g00303761 [Helianthus anomalus]